MSENDPNDTGAMALTGEDLVEGAAVSGAGGIQAGIVAVWKWWSAKGR